MLGELGESVGNGTCRRHVIHGRMKYLGSTNGAVRSESAVEINQMMKKDVVGPP